MDDDLSVAWLVKRAVVSRILRGKPAPDINDVDNALIEGTNAGRLVWSSMVPDIIAKVVGRGPLEKEVAETYSHRLGEDLDAVSSKALKEGYTASLSKGIDRSLSWARVAEAWGLDSAQMRSFIGSMKEDAYSTDLIPRRSMKQLEVMLNTRADRINENESYAIGQLAKQIYWIKLQQTGEIGPDVRKRWHTAADERVCPVCGPIDQKVVSLTNVFAEGVFAPPVHPNCRCWTEIIESTVVTKRDYKRDEDGKFARVNTLNMSAPEGHPYGRDTFGNPRPSRTEITRMQKETTPLKTGKGGYDIVGGTTKGAHSFGGGMSLVPTRDEKYYQMQYRDWFDKKIDHDLFSPDEYYARTWALGMPYKQPTEEEIFTEEERANRAAKFKEIEDRWNDNVKRANAEGRAPDMPPYEDLATYWHWDPEWASAAGRWEGKYREFHPSDKKKDISQHRMYQELAYDKKFNDEKKKELPPYEGLRRDGKKISYTPLAREYDDEFGLNPHNYPYRRVTTDSDAWKQFESDFITREAALTALREDPEIVNLIDRENRAKKGAELYRESQKVKTLADVYNAGSERNSKRLPINPKKYQQGLKLRRLRADIEELDSGIRQRVEGVSKTITDVDTREYKRDPDGKFATVNTLVPKVEHTGPSLPKNRAKPIPQRQLSHREIARFTAIRDGRVITALDREEPVRDLKKVAVQQTVPYWRNTDINFVPQPAHPAVVDTVEEVSQVIYDSKIRAGKKPKYKLKPKSVKMKIASPVEETKFDLSSPIPISAAPSEKVGTYTAKPEVRGLGADDVIFVVLPKKSRDSVIEGGRIDFSELPPLEAFDPAVVSLEELNLADTDQILMISGATWHPSKSGDGTGVLAGSYNVLTYRYIDEEAAFAIHAQRGIDAYVLAPDNPESTRIEDVIETNPDTIEGGRKTRTTSYDNIDVREREEGADWVDPRGGAVLGGEFGPGYGTQQKWAKSVGLPKEEYDLTAWAKKEGLSRSAVEPKGYVDWASTQSPYKPNSLSKRLPWPRKVT